MGRPPCCDKANVKRGLWTAEEDAKILAYVSNHGIGNWTQVPKKAGLNRCGKSCRLRWTNYLRPDLKHEEFTQQEEELIVKFHAAIGSRWSLIAKQLPGRTDNDVKNYWNTKLKKKLAKMGIDPMTHKPIVKIISDYETITSSTSNPHIKDLNKNLTKVDENQIKNTNYLNNNLFLNQLTELDLIENGSFSHCSLEEISSSSSSSSSSSITNDKSSNLMIANGLSSTLINMKTSYNCMEPSLFNNSLINVDNKPMQCLRIGENYTDKCAGNAGNATHVGRKTAGSNDRSNYESSSSVNSFVMAMLERDCQMQQEFSIFEDILDY